MKVHVLGVCGTFMGGVAQLAVARGHAVSGTDASFYEPMASQLRAAGIDCASQPLADLRGHAVDEYVVGNVISRGNQDAEAILAAGTPFVSGPAWLAREVLAQVPDVVAVAGTHGKTTTTAMIIHILEQCGRDPGYLVGGVPRRGAPSARLGGGGCFVVEADEYDTAFWDKRPKFIHYWAKVAVLNNVEFDHADIYPDLASIERQFALLPRQVRPGGTVVANWADELVRRAIPARPWHGVVRFNDPVGLHWAGTELRDGAAVLGTATHLPVGRHNQANALAALAACRALGVAMPEALVALATFVLPSRRMEVIHSAGGVIVLDDFAHHPTAIRATIATLAEAYPATRLLVALEPCSNTMRAGHWQDELAGCLAGADRVYVLATGLEWDPAVALAPLGDRVLVCADVGVLHDALVAELVAGDVLALLSNGDFGGLRQDLPKALAGRAVDKIHDSGPRDPMNLPC